MGSKESRLDLPKCWNTFAVQLAPPALLNRWTIINLEVVGCTASQPISTEADYFLASFEAVRFNQNDQCLSSHYCLDLT